MDTKTFQEITGLSNYVGFKSLLKNSLMYGVNYSCSDDTIVFNQVFNESLNINFTWNPNQVAVVLSAHGKIGYVDVNGVSQSLQFSGTQTDSASNLIVGMGFTVLQPSAYCMIAIFDLY